MEKSKKLNTILQQIKKLDDEARLFILERLANQLRTSRRRKVVQPVKLSDLNGLGSDIWKGIDIDQYVEQQRKWD